MPVRAFNQYTAAVDEELRAAEAHIARLEEEVLRLKDAKRELQATGSAHQELRRSAEGRVAKILSAPFRFFRRAKSKAPSENDYENWFARHRVTTEEAQRLRESSQTFVYRPLVSVLLPTFEPNEKFLREAVASVTAQIYENWELIIVDDGSPSVTIRSTLENIAQSDPRIHVAFEAHGGISAALNSALARAGGDWIALLDHDDLLEPDAIFRAIELLQNDPEADLIYSDEDKIVDGHFGAPMFKPDWSPDFFLTHDYLGHFLMIRRERAAEGFKSQFDGAQDYDLLLHISEKTDRIRHLPRVLYHWRRTPQSTAHNIRRKPGALEAGKNAIAEHLTRRGENARVTIDWDTHLYRVRPVGKSSAVTIFCQDCDEENIRARTSSVEIEFARRLTNDSWSDLLLFLDSDLEPLQENWLEILAGQMQRAEIGAAGARILATDETVESAGLVLLPGGDVKRAFAGCTRDFRGANRQLRAVRNYSAVSGACLLTRRELFEKYAGAADFKRDECAVIEFCLKIQTAGWRVVSIPDSELQRRSATEAAPLFCPNLEKRWPRVFARDPFYHPNLSRETADFSLGK